MSEGPDKWLQGMCPGRARRPKGEGGQGRPGLLKSEREDGRGVATEERKRWRAEREGGCVDTGWTESGRVLVNFADATVNYKNYIRNHCLPSPVSQGTTRPPKSRGDVPVPLEGRGSVSCPTEVTPGVDVRNDRWYMTRDTSLGDRGVIVDYHKGKVSDLLRRSLSNRSNEFW